MVDFEDIVPLDIGVVREELEVIHMDIMLPDDALLPHLLHQTIILYYLNIIYI